MCAKKELLTNYLVRQPLPECAVYHEFSCASCGRRFSLLYDTKYKTNGTWEVVHNINIIDIYKEESYTNDEQFEKCWSDLYSYCNGYFEQFPETLKHLLDDMELPEDVKVVVIFMLKEGAKDWIKGCIPALKYKKPIELAKTKEGLCALKSILHSMPQ